MKRSKTKKNAISRGIFFSSASFLVFVICIFSLFLSPCSVWAVNATLTWNANTEEDLAGYRIFYRAEGQSYNYDTPAWEGMAETCIISDLDDNTTYYFVVKAFDTSDNESTDSAEACYLPNRPPVLNAIGTKTVNENESLVFTISASDPDTDTLTYTAGNLPTGASFDAAQQRFSWTPGYGASGNYTVIFTVTDNGTPIKSDSEEITITVGNVNRPPVLNAIGAKTVDENELLEFTISASDLDADALTYTASSLPTGASFDDAQQRFSWTPGYSTAGNYTVTFTATDNGTPAQSDSETVTITVGNVNRPPVLNAIGTKTVNENELLEFTITASDPDADTLIYTAGGLPTGAGFNAAQQRFSWTPGYGAAGNYTVTFTATDNGTPAQNDSETVTITVGDVNRPPVLNAIGAKTVDENELLEFTITASDPDADALTYAASNLPTGASFDDAQQRFNWTPGYGESGNYTVTFTATDNGTPAQSDSETITITVGNVNRPPVLNSIGAKTVDENELLEFTITASDPDADILTYTASNLPTGASFDDAQQKFSWTPGYGAAGNYTVTFTVTDDGAPTQSDSETITITVEIPEDNVPPAPPVNVHVHIE
ncbi:MAG: putative Ig domain-containing protein [Pseudomonadota bacterium]|nr:putative Ig domain-containing protein [Pseudomonadota bacterium]